jgi:hypothetical protein
MGRRKKSNFAIMDLFILFNFIFLLIIIILIFDIIYNLLILNTNTNDYINNNINF